MMCEPNGETIVEVIAMADRKQFFGVADADPRLLRLLAESRTRIVSDDELREQRISFAFGNSLNSDRITKDSVRKASESIRLLPQDNHS
jgi:hypothetical protein